jgi:tetratricopeptide (TPR) repeat protein
MTPDALARAEAEFQHAIDLDPDYANAYANLAVTKYNQGVARGFGKRTDAERSSAERLARRALDLEPDYPAPRVLLAMLALQYDWDWSGAERELRTAVAGSPSADAESQYAFLLVFRGRFAEAEPHIQRMLELDPFDTTVKSNLAVCRYLEGRFAEARAVSERIIADYPGTILPREIIGGAYIQEGHPELATPVIQQMEQRVPQFRLLEAAADAAAGRRAEALRVARVFEDKYPDPGVAMANLGNFYALLGDEPSALKWLERSAERHEYRILMIGVNPAFAKIRNTPGFRALEHRVGLD